MTLDYGQSMVTPEDVEDIRKVGWRCTILLGFSNPEPAI